MTHTTRRAQPMAGRMMEDGTSVTGGTGLTGAESPNRGRVGVGVGGRLTAPPLKAGTYVARCSGWVEIGTVPGFAGRGGDFETGRLGDSKPKMQRRVMVTWTIRGSAGESWRVSREFSLSAGPRGGLRRVLETWRGRPYASDLEARAAFGRPERILEQPCIVTVSVSPAGWPKIESVVGLPMGIPAPESLRWPPVLFTWAKPDRETFRGLPAWVQRKVKESEEWGLAGRGNDKAQATPTRHAANTQDSE